MTLLKSMRLEIYKLRHRYFFLTWLALTLAPLFLELYNLRNLGFSDRYFFPEPVLYYYYLESASVELLSLFLPIMASILISKLCDIEHKQKTWKMLLTNNQDFETLWWAKFLIVYIFMELTVIIFYVVLNARIYLSTGTPVPVILLFKSFLGISGVNIIVLVLAESLAIYYFNQVIVLVEGIVGGFIGIISSLLPRAVIRFIPWGYYALNILAGNQPDGFNADGEIMWKIYTIQPEYLLIAIISLVFLILGFMAARYLSRREL